MTREPEYEKQVIIITILNERFSYFLDCYSPIVTLIPTYSVEVKIFLLIQLFNFDVLSHYRSLQNGQSSIVLHFVRLQFQILCQSTQPSANCSINHWQTSVHQFRKLLYIVQRRNSIHLLIPVIIRRMIVVVMSTNFEVVSLIFVEIPFISKVKTCFLLFKNLINSLFIQIFILYMIFIIYFTIAEIHTIYLIKFAYFHQLRSYFELGIILYSWINTGIDIWRYEEMKRIGSLFRETNGFIFINLQQAVYIDNIFTILLSFCCFFATLRLLDFCRLNQRLSILHDTLEHVIKDLPSFLLTFVILFLSFFVLFYLLFHSTLRTCSSLLHTFQMLFEMSLLKFNANDFYQVDAFLGPFCFVLFIIFVVMICMNMFISINWGSFRAIHRISNDDQELFQYMIQRFLRWIDESEWKKIACGRKICFLGMKKFDQEE